MTSVIDRSGPPSTTRPANLRVPGYQVTSSMRFTPTSRTVERTGDFSSLPPGP